MPDSSHKYTDPDFLPSTWRTVMERVDNVALNMTRLSAQLENTDEILREIVKIVRGGDGDDALLTRLRLIERDMAQMITRMDATDKQREERDREARTQRWQLIVAITAASMSTIVTIVVAVIHLVRG